MNKKSTRKKPLNLEAIENGCTCSSGQINRQRENYSPSEEEIIEQGFEQMEMLYKSRCVAMSGNSNVTVTEIKSPGHPEIK